jgi:hypothetical protein
MSGRSATMENSIFESSMRSFGDLIAVFESDRDGGYFYLFDITKDEGRQARGVVEIDTLTDLRASDVSVCWSVTEEFVGLFLAGTLRAAFDRDAQAYKANHGMPLVAPEIVGRFGSVSKYV